MELQLRVERGKKLHIMAGLPRALEHQAVGRMRTLDAAEQKVPETIACYALTNSLTVLCKNSKVIDNAWREGVVQNWFRADVLFMYRLCVRPDCLGGT